MERGAARLLLGGVVAAFACLAAGVGLWLAGAAAGDWLLDAGLIILMATPALRVFLSALEFAAARDWLFTAAAAAVLAVLAASILYSRSA